MVSVHNVQVPTSAGSSLSRILDRCPRGLGPETSLALLLDLLAVLDARHRRGEVHGDVRADCVVVGRDGLANLKWAGPTRDGSAARDVHSAVRLMAQCLRCGQPPGIGLPALVAPVFAFADASIASADHPPTPTAAELSAEVIRAARASFDAGWRDRARERLAKHAAARHPALPEPAYRLLSRAEVSSSGAATHRATVRRLLSIENLLRLAGITSLISAGILASALAKSPMMRDVAPLVAEATLVVTAPSTAP